MHPSYQVTPVRFHGSTTPPSDARREQISFDHLTESVQNRLFEVLYQKRELTGQKGHPSIEFNLYELLLQIPEGYRWGVCGSAMGYILGESILDDLRNNPWEHPPHDIDIFCFDSDKKHDQRILLDHYTMFFACKAGLTIDAFNQYYSFNRWIGHEEKDNRAQFTFGNIDIAFIHNSHITHDCDLNALMLCMERFEYKSYQGCFYPMPVRLILQFKPLGVHCSDFNAAFEDLKRKRFSSSYLSSVRNGALILVKRFVAGYEMGNYGKPPLPDLSLQAEKNGITNYIRKCNPHPFYSEIFLRTLDHFYPGKDVLYKFNLPRRSAINIAQDRSWISVDYDPHLNVFNGISKGGRFRIACRSLKDEIADLDNVKDSISEWINNKIYSAFNKIEDFFGLLDTSVPHNSDLMAYLCEKNKIMGFSRIERLHPSQWKEEHTQNLVTRWMIGYSYSKFRMEEQAAQFIDLYHHKIIFHQKHNLPEADLLSRRKMIEPLAYLDELLHLTESAWKKMQLEKGVTITEADFLNIEKEIDLSLKDPQFASLVYLIKLCVNKGEGLFSGSIEQFCSHLTLDNENRLIFEGSFKDNRYKIAMSSDRLIDYVKNGSQMTPLIEMLLDKVISGQARDQILDFWADKKPERIVGLLSFPWMEPWLQQKEGNSFPWHLLEPGSVTEGRFLANAPEWLQKLRLQILINIKTADDLLAHITKGTPVTYLKGELVFQQTHLQTIVKKVSNSGQVNDQYGKMVALIKAILPLFPGYHPPQSDKPEDLISLLNSYFEKKVVIEIDWQKGSIKIPFSEQMSLQIQHPSLRKSFLGYLPKSHSAAINSFFGREGLHFLKEMKDWMNKGNPEWLPLEILPQILSGENIPFSTCWAESVKKYVELYPDNYEKVAGFIEKNWSRFKDLLFPLYLNHLSLPEDQDKACSLLQPIMKLISQNMKFWDSVCPRIMEWFNRYSWGIAQLKTLQMSKELYTNFRNHFRLDCRPNLNSAYPSFVKLDDYLEDCKKDPNLFDLTTALRISFASNRVDDRLFPYFKDVSWKNMAAGVSDLWKKSLPFLDRPIKESFMGLWIKEWEQLSEKDKQNIESVMNGFQEKDWEIVFDLLKDESEKRKSSILTRYNSRISKSCKSHPMIVRYMICDKFPNFVKNAPEFTIINNLLPTLDQDLVVIFVQKLLALPQREFENHWDLFKEKLVKFIIDNSSFDTTLIKKLCLRLKAKDLNDLKHVESLWSKAGVLASLEEHFSILTMTNQVDADKRPLDCPEKWDPVHDPIYAILVKLMERVVNHVGNGSPLNQKDIEQIEWLLDKAPFLGERHLITVISQKLSNQNLNKLNLEKLTTKLRYMMDIFMDGHENRQIIAMPRISYVMNFWMPLIGLIFYNAQEKSNRTDLAILFQQAFILNVLDQREVYVIHNFLQMLCTTFALIANHKGKYEYKTEWMENIPVQSSIMLYLIPLQRFLNHVSSIDARMGLSQNDIQNISRVIVPRVSNIKIEYFRGSPDYEEAAKDLVIQTAIENYYQYMEIEKRFKNMQMTAIQREQQSKDLSLSNKLIYDVLQNSLMSIDLLRIYRSWELPAEFYAKRLSSFSSGQYITTPYLTMLKRLLVTFFIQEEYRKPNIVSQESVLSDVHKYLMPTLRRELQFFLDQEDITIHLTQSGILTWIAIINTLLARLISCDLFWHSSEEESQIYREMVENHHKLVQKIKNSFDRFQKVVIDPTPESDVDFKMSFSMINSIISDVMIFEMVLRKRNFPEDKIKGLVNDVMDFALNTQQMFVKSWMDLKIDLQSTQELLYYLMMNSAILVSRYNKDLFKKYNSMFEKDIDILYEAAQPVPLHFSSVVNSYRAIMKGNG